MASYLSDKDFADTLLTFVCRDRAFLKRCASILEAADFRPRKSQSLERFVIASIALELWGKYH